MKDLLDKLSSYNIFNYLFPGILFVIFAEKFTSIALIQKDIILGVFLYYFIGLVISRIGSLCIEPLLKKIGFLIFAEYSEFISAAKLDGKLEILSEQNNMYRTLCSLFLSITMIKSYEWITEKYSVVAGWGRELTIVGLLVLFIFAYRKQTGYITKRIKAALKKDK